MRSHSEIIRKIGAAAVTALTEKPAPTVYSWMRRDSIPSEHWAVLVAAGHCTADELMHAAAAKRAA